MSPHAILSSCSIRDIEDNYHMGKGLKTEPGSSPAPSNDTFKTDMSESKENTLLNSADEEIHDFICAGFGPASLAIAIALQDRRDVQPWIGYSRFAPKVLFLEKQAKFAWHSGMLLPSAKMQISFMKDMATLRNPRSHFTFINYLFQNQRLVAFTNLDTFLPARIEFEDYLRWCARHFEGDAEQQGTARYGQEVVQVRRGSQVQGTAVPYFEVLSRDIATGETTLRKTKHVIIATGGAARIPAIFPAKSPRVIHSSQYHHLRQQILPDRLHPYRIAVIGGGQSAAEIFNDLHDLYPNSTTRLLIKVSALRPSDDSPFVNEVFNPDRVDPFYSQSEQTRSQLNTENKLTNYGVVRLGLLETIYETLYMQRLSHGNNEAKWPHRILPFSHVLSVQDTEGAVKLVVRRPSDTKVGIDEEKGMEFDAVILGTGYTRNAHEELLSSLRDLQADQMDDSDANADNAMSKPLASGWKTRRDYSVVFRPGAVEKDCGIWLQGCCEASHGLADSLLSILSVRAGEIVDSIFGPPAVPGQKGNAFPTAS